MVGLDKHLVDIESSQASGFISRFQESMNVNCGTGVSTAVNTDTKIHLQLDKSSNEVER